MTPPQHQPGARLIDAIAIARGERAPDPAALAPRLLRDLDDIEPVVDLSPAELPEGPIAAPDEDYGLGPRWGAKWKTAAQGWVDSPSGREWRPVITTTTDFPEWEVDTYLGVITGESAVDHSFEDAATLGRLLAEGREVAMQSLSDAAVARGAHAVVGVTMEYTTLSRRLVVTASGTAVTLRDHAPIS